MDIARKLLGDDINDETDNLSYSKKSDLDKEILDLVFNQEIKTKLEDLIEKYNKLAIKEEEEIIARWGSRCGKRNI